MSIKEKHPCESPDHHPNCPCQSCKLSIPESCQSCPLITVDHVTPRSIAKKVFGWSDEQIHHKSNLMFLSRTCHKRKDYDTPKRLDVGLRQARGEVFDWPKHRRQFGS